MTPTVLGSRILQVVASAFTLLSADAMAKGEAAKKANDVKPAHAKGGFDEEQMRPSKIIHKRIVGYQQIKKWGHNGKEEQLVPFKEAPAFGASVEMLPVKGGGFTWEAYEPVTLSQIPRHQRWPQERQDR